MKTLERNHRFKSMKEMQDLLQGKKITIISNLSGSQIPEGTKTKVMLCYSPTTGNAYVTTEARPGSCVYMNEFKLGGDTIPDLEEETLDLEKEIVAKKSEIELNKAKIKFMKAHKLTEFDETDFKVYETLELLENTSITKVERAKAIAKLIKG